MNAYLFSAGITQTQVAPSSSGQGGMIMQAFDTCISMIVSGTDAGAAQARLEEILSKPSEGENPAHAEIKKIVAVQLIGQLFTEAGPQTFDLAKIREQWLKNALEQPADDFEQGYWVNANEAVPPETGKLTFADLQACLPEDLKSGLNWSADKQFFYLLTVFARWPEPSLEEPEQFQENEDGEQEEDKGPRAPELDSSILALPEMREKDAAVIIQARNSIVAAWAWRKFAWEQTDLALNEIYVTPLCDIVV